MIVTVLILNREPDNWLHIQNAIEHETDDIAFATKVEIDKDLILDIEKEFRSGQNNRYEIINVHNK